MHTKGFIGSFALSALLVSAAGALLVVMGALLAFDGFPGPNLEDSTKLMRVASVSAGEQTKPQLVLDPPTASALEPGGPGSEAAGSTDAADAAAASALDTATADAATFAPPAEDAQSGTAPTAPPVGGGDPELPGGDGGGSGGPTNVVQSSLDRAAPVTDGVRDALDGVSDGLGLP
jgi:hypothetical protein